VLSDLDGRPPGSVDDESRAALAQVPHATAWARRFTRGIDASARDFRRRAAPMIVRYAVTGVARACVSDPDALLRDLLLMSIDECATWVGRDRLDRHLARTSQDYVGAVGAV
jgi:hypothetical protein